MGILESRLRSALPLGWSPVGPDNVAGHLPQQMREAAEQGNQQQDSPDCELQSACVSDLSSIEWKCPNLLIRSSAGINEFILQTTGGVN